MRGRGIRWTDALPQWAAGEGRAQRHELPALQVPEGFRLSPLHAEKVGGARHVDIQEGTTHQEIGSLGCDVLGELRQSLGCDDPRKSALAAAAHQVRHGAEREFAGFVRNFPSDSRREELRLVHHHQHRIPMVAADFEKPAQEGRGAPHLVLGVEPLKIEHCGDAMDACSLAGDLQAALGMVLGIDHQMAEMVGQRHEVAFGVDDGLLHPGALCSSSRRSRWDLPDPELPCTSRRVASSSSRSSAAEVPAVVCPISIATVMYRLNASPVSSEGLST